MRAICIASGATCYWRPASRPRPFSCCRVHRQGCRRTAGDGAVVAAAAVVVVQSDCSRPTQWQRAHASSPCCKAAAWCKWSIAEALLFRRAEMNQICGGVRPLLASKFVSGSAKRDGVQLTNFHVD